METGASEARMRKWRRRRKRKRKLQKLLQHSFPNGIALRQSSSWFPRLKQWKLHIARAEAEATAKSLSRGFLVSQGWKWSLGGSGVDRDDDEELQSEVIWGKNWFNFLLELLDEFVKSLRFQRLQPAQLGLKQVDVNIFSQNLLAAGIRSWCSCPPAALRIAFSVKAASANSDLRTWSSTRRWCFSRRAETHGMLKFSLLSGVKGRKEKEKRDS